MSAKTEEFIVLVVCNTDSTELHPGPMAATDLLLRSYHPVAKYAGSSRVVGYYLCSQIVSSGLAELLMRLEHVPREHPLFKNLATGLGHGPMVVDFDSLGPIEENSPNPPVGEALNNAAQNALVPDGWRVVMADLYRKNVPR